MKGSLQEIIYCFLFGPALLSWGMAAWRKKRLVQNVPKSAVKSAPMGFVELAGMARERKEIKTPFSKLPCCWWRCRVEEKRGKNWHTLSTRDCGDFFYLEDDTGKILVDPRGAELYVDALDFPLSSDPSAYLPVLSSWGFNGKSLFGVTKQIRIKEEYITLASPVYALGHIVNTVDHLQDRKNRHLQMIRTIKSDPAKMAEADANKDGLVDSIEWDNYRKKAEEEFLEREMSRKDDMPECDKRIMRLVSDQHFIISTSEQLTENKFTLHATLGILGGGAAITLGAVLGQKDGWPVPAIIAVVLLGIACGSLLSKMVLKFK
jgi:hypothetical protein